MAFSLDKEGFPEREERIADFWEKQAIFKKSMDMRKDAPSYTFYDGPPFATGLPHYGHLLAGTIKDVVGRYHSMQGKNVVRRFGWDCHGLPVENEIEKREALSGSGAIESFGIDSFNEECRSIVFRYVNEWESTVKRMGRLVDFERTYKTMDLSYMESVWWVFGELWKKDLVYQGFKVMPFSAKLGTPLSNFEANLSYRDVDDPSVTVSLQLVNESDTSLLIWTTTPWTLISNLATVVNPDMTYVKVLQNGKKYVLAQSRLEAYFKENFEVVDTFKGETLVGKKYVPPFDYYAEEKAFLVLGDGFVGEDDGTGIVHAAPAFGESDFFVCLREGIEPVCPVDQNGKFLSVIPEYEGLFVKDADKDIIKRLKETGHLFKQASIRHRYPFCWRSDTPLIYKAVETWFVKVESIKEKLIAANKKIRWVPDHIKSGRFGKWLENARDWSIGRNRYWGTPIPIWTDGEGNYHVVKSIAELEELSGEKVTDLHRHKIDHITFEIDGKVYKRIPEVFDCWFESGSMPYAQNHFPFENEKETLDHFPADFIAEGLDQTRGWFYTLTVLGVALFDKPAFKNVIVNGILLAEDGMKMSKSLKNYPPPEEVINQYGADAVRLYLLSSPAVRGDDLRFSKRGVELVLRQVLLPLWNSYVFFATYANIYGFEPKKGDVKPKAAIDRWILSRVSKLAFDVSESMEKYQLAEAVEPFISCVDGLTNWYIRRSRARFWADEDTDDRKEAFETLRQVLLTLSKIAAPFIPFLSDALYKNLKGSLESVHLEDFPGTEGRDLELEKEMELVQVAVAMGRALRKEHQLKVRQPLNSVQVIAASKESLELLKQNQSLIKDELNVKHVEFSSEEEDLVVLKAKPNFRVLGKKVGPLMKEAKAAIEALPRKQILAFQTNKELTLQVAGKDILLESDDIVVTREVKEGLVAASDQGVTLVLDTALTPELLEEGMARELVNKLNTARRDTGLAVTDRIRVTLDGSNVVKSCFDKYQEYIMHETLTTHVDFAPIDGEEIDLNGQSIKLTISRI